MEKIFTPGEIKPSDIGKRIVVRVTHKDPDTASELILESSRKYVGILQSFSTGIDGFFAFKIKGMPVVAVREVTQKVDITFPANVILGNRTIHEEIR